MWFVFGLCYGFLARVSCMLPKTELATFEFSGSF